MTPVFVAAAGLVTLGITEAELVSLREAHEVGGWLALVGAAVAIVVRLARPALQRRVRAEWPAAPWAGYLVTGLLALAAGLGTELATGIGLSWALLQSALVAAISLALTPGLDARTAAARR